MFTKDVWLLYDYNEELVETNDQYLKIGYNEKDVNIVSYDTIINKPNKKILNYEFNSYIYDLFESFKSYVDILHQSEVDLIRSNVYINNRKINPQYSHKRLINKMDL